MNNERSILEWDEDDVHAWFTSLGYPQYEAQLHEHNISGDILCMLDSEGLKGIGISTIGQRLYILKAVYQVKLLHNVPIDEDHYIPPSEALGREAMTVEKLHNVVNDQATRINHLEDDNRQLHNSIHTLIEEFSHLRASYTQNVAQNSKADDSSPIKRQPSFKWANFIKPQRSPTKLDIIESPHPSPAPSQLEHDIPAIYNSNSSLPQTKQTNPTHTQSSSNEPAAGKRKGSNDSPNIPNQTPPMGLSGSTGSHLSSTSSSTQISSTATATASSTNQVTPSTAQSTSSILPSASSSSLQKPHRQESSDNLKGDNNLKSFKVSLEDPTWKVLPAALKKYRINNDNWQNYAMFICYGAPGNRIERCLSYDEKPLLLFQKLKDAKKNPVFMLKHIKDIRSPIAVAQQKHAARKAGSIISNATSATEATTGHHKGAANSGIANGSVADADDPKHARSMARPPKLQVNDFSVNSLNSGSSQGISSSVTGGSTNTLAGSSGGLLSTGLSPHPGWPESGVLSPGGLDTARSPIQDGKDDTSTQHAPYSSTMSGSTLVGGQSNEGSGSGPGVGASSSGREMPPLTGGVSYAVAIYPYMAEQDDEFDVVVGDTFVILSRARGWWVVQRDPTGSGIVDTEISKQGWVPAGCLLETNVPVASAIAEATASKTATHPSSPDGFPNSPPATPAAKTPILPLSIISTSFPGIALMDYKKKGDEELDLAKDDALRVFKRYNHWSYAVKEDGGDRGWVPSWFIGKVATTPATPSAYATNNSSGLDDGNGQPQVSPMSSAFPTMQSRS